MSGSTTLFHFGEFELDLAVFELRHNGTAVHVEPRAIDLLAYLVAHRNRVVGKDELFDKVWGSQFVSESALTTTLKSARRALGDSGAEQRFIRTVHRRGYQFCAAVVQTESAQTDSAQSGAGSRSAQADFVPAGSGAAATGRHVVTEERAPPVPEGGLSDSQEIRFCVAPDGASIAYATVGTGPVLMKAANWLSHLDLEWSTPVWSHWLHGLAAGRTLVRYDERGCGLSEWDVPGFGFDDWVTDLEAVVDAVGLDRFPLLGVSQGGPVAVAYAVRHPERVSRLILCGAYARGRLVRARTPDERRAAELDIELARVGWTRTDPSYMQVFAAQFLPEGTEEQRREFTAFLRQTTSAENAVRFLEVFGGIDVSALAPQVSCPTLILHSRRDVRVPVDQAMELAALIPGSRLVFLDSPSHLLTEHEPAWPEFLAHLDRFLR